MNSWIYPTSTLWMHYADIFNLLGPMPINGGPYDADCAIALSFGRNSIPDNHLPCIHIYRNSASDRMATIYHVNNPCFGGFDPGKPNHDIAVRGIQIIEWYREADIPLIAQWEIAMSMYHQRGAEWIQDKFDNQKLFCLWPPNRPSYRTIEVLEDAFKFTQEHGWKRPVLLAHDCYMPRVAILARHFWLEFIIGFPTITCAFDSKSVQPQCASSQQWYMSELKIRAHHLFYGWCFGHFKWGRF